MSKAKFKEKQKKLHEQRVRPTEETEVVPAWDYDFSGANEVHQSDDFEPLESVALFIPEGKSKTREKFKKKRDKARHKLDVSVSPETASDYLCADGIIYHQTGACGAPQGVGRADRRIADPV